MILVAVVARARNGVIGHEGRMPWDLPGDLRRFKQKTLGTPLIMGRKTFESIGRPLPGRRNIVVTRQEGWSAEGAERAATLQKAVEMCREAERVSIIGGGEIYRQMMPYIHEVLLTEVHAEPEGDTVFPDLDPTQWEETARETLETHSYVDFRRRSEPPEPFGRLN